MEFYASDQPKYVKPADGVWEGGVAIFIAVTVLSSQRLAVL
jgi:hypothetical protein